MAATPKAAAPPPLPDATGESPEELCVRLEQVANTRRTLLQVITDYNVAIVQLEKAKGTLLEYNNVVVTDEPDGR